ncbi:DUF3024 domain-containing protein [Vibrio rumoiensis]|uniref:DUF3024 domain-containing protein n=1 Tax=Vibrio rumoiensis 1S-45 TaxID=1188252 RepID=A0A1E5DZ37_9VIBR|nr:DUF3024 domain-containing protein [Vibrio rumoiensis]OEF23149.1 hypothetical protein A1QC_02780 [Vibrio rumoiensis 1S-45]
MISELEWRRITKRAEELCHYRNESVPVAQGKACFDFGETHVVFSKAVFSVDSMHCSHMYDVAKLIFYKDKREWRLFVRRLSTNNEQPEWKPHTSTPRSQDPIQLIELIEKDKEECIWV